MRACKFLLLSALPVFIIGCASPVPVAQNFPRSYQKVARTAHHWDVVARDVAMQTGKMVSASRQLQARDLYVPVGERNSFFDSTFREFLVDHMVNSGMQVLACPPGPAPAGFEQAPAVTVHYDTRVVRHEEMPRYQPGLMTALATGIYAMHGVAKLDNGDARVVGAIAGIAGVDAWLAQMPDETRTELIITATIQEGNRFVMRRSLIYYVPDGDWELFRTRSDKPGSCDKGRAVAATGKDMPKATDRETEMGRLRAEKVERDMIRFNQDYQPAKMKVSYLE